MRTIERIIEQEIFTNASTLISSLCRSEDPELMNVDQDDLISVCIQPDYSTAPGGYEIEETDGAYYWYQLAETDDDAISSDSVFATPEVLVLTRGTTTATLLRVALRHCSIG